MMSFASLRSQLTPGQLEILTTIWDYYQTSSKWIRSGALHHELGKDAHEVLSILAPLGGSVVFDTPNSPKRYVLTFLGIILTDLGGDVETALATYLETVRGMYLSDFELENVDLRNVATKLGLDREKSKFLEEVVFLSPFMGGGGGGVVGIPPDLDDLVRVQDFHTYVRDRAIRDYDPAVPIDGNKRMGYLDRAFRERIADANPLELRHQGIGDVTSTAHGEAGTDRLARTDVAFDSRLQSAAGTVSSISVLFVDLDKFKVVNDSYDHETGDRVIQDALRKIGEIVYLKGEVSRRSGAADEFLISLPNFSVDEAGAVAERIRAEIQEHDFPAVGKGAITASIGLSNYPVLCDRQQLALTADRACIQAKRSGKNRVEVYRADDIETLQIKLAQDPACAYLLLRDFPDDSLNLLRESIAQHPERADLVKQWEKAIDSIAGTAPPASVTISVTLSNNGADGLDVLRVDARFYTRLPWKFDETSVKNEQGKVVSFPLALPAKQQVALKTLTVMNISSDHNYAQFAARLGEIDPNAIRNVKATIAAEAKGVSRSLIKASVSVDLSVGPLVIQYAQLWADRGLWHLLRLLEGTKKNEPLDHL
jgi:diguanylate cyclase (GGDEF)-like protein